MGTKTVYSPTCTGSPAIVAYAIALGMTTAAEVRPAIRSDRSQLFWYENNQSGIGKRARLSRSIDGLSSAGYFGLSYYASAANCIWWSRSADDCIWSVRDPG